MKVTLTAAELIDVMQEWWDANAVRAGKKVSRVEIVSAEPKRVVIHLEDEHPERFLGLTDRFNES